MQASNSDRAALQQAGYTYEHPGYWGKNIGAYCATISADAPYVVQIMTADGSDCVYAATEDFATAQDAVAHASAWIASR